MSRWRELHAGRGEYCLKLLSRVKARLFTALLSTQFGSCGRGVVVCPPCRFGNLRFVHLEDNVIVNRDCWISTVVRAGEPPPRLVIEAGASIGMGATIAAAREVVLGEHVMLARNVYIADHGHAFEDVQTPSMLQGIRDVRPVSIGDGVWLGQNVCVLPGVRIGRHSVIGANSVVTRDVPDFCVAVGMPARVVKRYNAATKEWEKVV
jgi:acetyltransferase-like isoleucine patch superfamily enzyme